MDDDLLPWRSFDVFTIDEAALLICGVAPGSIQKPPQYEPWVKLMSCAILSNELTIAGSEEELGPLSSDLLFYSNDNKPRVYSSEIRAWLPSKGVTTGFFFDDPCGSAATASKVEAKDGAGMDHLLPWRLYDKLTISEAAWLLCGVDPNSDPTLDRPPQYCAWVDLIVGAVRKGELFETLRVEGAGGITGGVILVKNLRGWLKGKGVTTGFSFDAPGGSEVQPPSGDPIPLSAKEAIQGDTLATHHTASGNLLKSKEEVIAYLGMSMGKFEGLLKRYPFQKATGVTGKIDGGWRVYTGQVDQWLTWVQKQETLHSKTMSSY